MNERTKLRSLVLVGAFAAVLALAVDRVSNPVAALFVLGSVSILTGIAVFLVDGGARVTPAGLLYLATSVFVGGAMLYLAELGSKSSSSTVLLAGFVSHGVLLLTIVLYGRWANFDDVESDLAETWIPLVDRRSNLVLLGTALLAAALALVQVGALGALAGAMGFAGLALLTATAVTMRSCYGVGLGVLGRSVPISLIVLYVSQTFSGSGRLVVTGLVLMFLYALSASRRSRFLKPAVVFALLPALAVAGAFDDGLQRGPSTSPSATLLDGAGLASMYSPLDSLAEIRERELDPSLTDVPRQYGGTLWATAVIWIPREVWPTKPLGWGAVLAETLSPQYRNGVSGHSDTALIVGESYANFGALGLVLLPAALAAVLAFLRRTQSGLLRCGALSQRQALRWAALLACVASLSDLVWGGTFSWAARGGMAAGLLLILSFLSKGDSPLSIIAGPSSPHRQVRGLDW